MISFWIPAIILGVTIALAWPLGRYMRWAMDPVEPGPIRVRDESVCATLLGRDTTRSQSWQAYCISLLVFNVLMFVFVYVVLTTQQWLPLNPDGKAAIEPSLAFHTAASFTSNTNLQHYSGEVSMSYFSQLFALMWLQFVSAATGIAAVAALCRGLAGRKELGNFFQDLWRADVSDPAADGGRHGRAAHPVRHADDARGRRRGHHAWKERRKPSLAGRSPPSWRSNNWAPTVAAGSGRTVLIRSRIPTFWSNVLCNVAIILIPMATVWMFGRITDRIRHAAVVFGVMLTLVLEFRGRGVLIRKSTHRRACRIAPRAIDEPGGQGAALRTDRRGNLGSFHHRDEQRQRQRHARQPQSAHGSAAADRHVAQLHLRRRRRRRDQHIPLHS